MTTSKRTRPSIDTIGSDTWRASQYDLAVFALGFESRATCFVKCIAPRSKHSVAFGFDHGHTESYSNNLALFLEAGVSAHQFLDDRSFEENFKGALALLSDNESERIFVDVSCFTRFRLASIVHEVFNIADNRTNELIVDFAYALAKFQRPSVQRHPNTVVGPAHRAFAGWSQGTYSSTAAVLGLGYEQDQAMGVVEYLQAGEVWAFSPFSPVPDYKPEVQKANELLLSEISPSHIIEYDVCSPSSMISTLESVVRGLSDEHSVVLVPFGPKIFVLCSLIVAAIRQDVAVWRVSQGSRIEPNNRVSSEIEVGVRLSFLGTKSLLQAVQ